MSSRGILVALATVGLIVLPACKPKPSTTLEIEITGGFAFVPSPQDQMLEVAYLNDVEIKEADGTVSCSVEQIGTELIVVRGDISQDVPPAPEDRIFDLNGWVVNFPALDKAKLKFAGYRPKGMPNPVVPGSTGNWSNPQYVPAIKDHHSLSGIKQNWRELVNGRVVLRGGKIVGGVPSDPLMQQAKFDFRLAGTSIGKAAVTDRMIYTVDVPDDKVEVVFTNSKMESKRLVLTPPAKNKPVRLVLRGLHAMPAAGAYANNVELKDFCAFYSLLDQDVPLPKRLRLFYEAPTPQQVASTVPQNFGPIKSQPSPGFYCSGDWF
jgi:hypothetical protein